MLGCACNSVNWVIEDKNVELGFIRQLKMHFFFRLWSFDEMIHSLNKNNGPRENTYGRLTPCISIQYE